MAVAFGTIGTYGTNSAICGKPTGTSVGDLLVIAWEDDIARTTASLATWTAVTPTTWNAAGRTIGVLWKIATATEVAAANFTVSNINSGTYGEAVCLRYTGTDLTTPIDVSKNDADTSTASSITTATANEIQLVAIAWDNGANTAAAPTGFTARLNPGTGDFYIADRVVASAGATATADFSATGTAGPKGIIQIAIQPPGGVTTKGIVVPSPRVRRVLMRK